MALCICDGRNAQPAATSHILPPPNDVHIHGDGGDALLQFTFYATCAMPINLKHADFFRYMIALMPRYTLASRNAYLMMRHLALLFTLPHAISPAGLFLDCA